ncbi:MAG: dinitrogenase iron-molybdenum cofactor biosynthesis protein [Planctomycetota bacterium]|nr:MAG: dinitrogenase iron-molybdenum cofactor biosynthesis protein [Planctomycetota bacterium]
MVVVVTSEGDTLDAKVDKRFGRCAWFLFYDVEKDELMEAVRNVAAAAAGGAGVQAAQFIVDKGAKIVITGDVGPNAWTVLRKAGVEVYVGAFGTVKDAIEAFRSGKLSKATEASVSGSAAARQGRYGKGLGPGGECVCPQCGHKIPHQAGTPCRSVNCPKCGAPMRRA